MPTPQAISELPVASQEDYRYIGIPDAKSINWLKGKGYGSFIRIAEVSRDPRLPNVNSINEHLAETDAEFRRLTKASRHIGELVGPVNIPSYRWCLIPHQAGEGNFDDLVDFIPKGFMIGAEVEIIEGDDVCPHLGYRDALPAANIGVVAARKVIAAYRKTRKDGPIIDDLFPYQFMKSRMDDGSRTQLYFNDIEPRLTIAGT